MDNTVSDGLADMLVGLVGLVVGFILASLLVDHYSRSQERDSWCRVVYSNTKEYLMCRQEGVNVYKKLEDRD